MPINCLKESYGEMVSFHCFFRVFAENLAVSVILSYDQECIYLR
jgi:hypothetical protein